MPLLRHLQVGAGARDSSGLPDSAGEGCLFVSTLFDKLRDLIGCNRRNKTARAAEVFCPKSTSAPLDLQIPLESTVRRICRRLQGSTCSFIESF
jgi:hypothetical protein